MKTFHATIVVMLSAIYAVSLTAKDAPEDFKKKLFDRYDQKVVACLPKQLVVGLPLNNYKGAGDIGPRYFGVVYTHFHESLDLPKWVRDRENIDDRTYIGVDADADSVRRVPTGERLRVIKFYLRGNGLVRLELMPISATLRGSSRRTGGDTRPYGLEFIFTFPKLVIETGDFDTVVREINRYVLPIDEYKDVAEAAKKIEIQPGMSKDEVVKAMGEPLKAVVFGSKTILKYADVTIELQDDKVSDLKTN